VKLYLEDLMSRYLWRL